MRGFHSHPCCFEDFGCDNQILCRDTNLRLNNDGFPEIICTLEILGVNFGMYCDDCEDRAICTDCGAPEHLPHTYDCPFWEREPYDFQIPIEAYDEDIAYEYL